MVHISHEAAGVSSGFTKGQQAIVVNSESSTYVATVSFEYSQLQVMRKYFRTPRTWYRLQRVQEKVVEYLHESGQQVHVEKDVLAHIPKDPGYHNGHD